MADISEWDPVDDANTHAPPNGWPEFMQPSAVNNAARAMMGAVRRWYDTVSAQITGINTAVNTKVSRSGDTMTGDLSINNATGNSGLLLNKSAAGYAQIFSNSSNVARWLIRFGDPVGSDFELHRYADNGGYLGAPMVINRATGLTSIGNGLSLSVGATAASHATRKDYVDQRDSDWYNAAWTNITQWAAGQDQYYYNAAIAYAASIHNTQQTDINNRVAKGGDTMSGVLAVPYIRGGPGDAGTLKGYDGHTICFRWVDNVNGAVGNSQLEYRIDEVVGKIILGTRNFYNAGLEVGGGGPTNWVYSGTDGTTWFYCHIDITASDERIKSNIADSEIDALGLLNRVKLSQFDIKPEVAAWCQSVGKEPEERTRMMRDAQAAHVGIGFVAQQVQTVIPEAVFCAHQHGLSPDGPLPDDLQSINNQMFIPYLVRAVQQLQARVEALEGRP